MKDTGIKSYESLFGDQNYRKGDHSRSVLSPAAYLLDLLQLLKENIFAPTTGLLALSNRRPDILGSDDSMKLSSENVSHEISYLDIINSVVENNIQTIINPSSPNSVDVFKNELRNAKYPFSLPFNLAHSQLTENLKYVNLKKEDIRLAYSDSSTSDYINSTSDDYLLNMAADYFGMSIEDVNSLLSTADPSTVADVNPYYGYSTGETDSINDLQVINEFMKRTELTLEDLNDLLYQNLSKTEINSGTVSHAFYINNVSSTPANSYLTTKKITIKGNETQVLGVANSPSTGNNTALADSSNGYLYLWRIFKFLKLSRKIRWKFSDLNLVVSTLNASLINKPLLPVLAAVDKLSKDLELSIAEVMGILAVLSLDCKGRSYDETNNRKKYQAEDIFDKIFNNALQELDAQKKSIQELYSISGSTQQLPYTRLVAALKVSETDIKKIENALINSWYNSGSDDTVKKINRISQIYRFVILSKRVELSISDFIDLLQITNQFLGNPSAWSSSLNGLNNPFNILFNFVDNSIQSIDMIELLAGKTGNTKLRLQLVQNLVMFTNWLKENDLVVAQLSYFCTQRNDTDWQNKTYSNDLSVSDKQSFYQRLNTDFQSILITPASFVSSDGSTTIDLETSRKIFNNQDVINGMRVYIKTTMINIGDPETALVAKVYNSGDPLNFTIDPPSPTPSDWNDQWQKKLALLKKLLPELTAALQSEQITRFVEELSTSFKVTPQIMTALLPSVFASVEGINDDISLVEVVVTFMTRVLTHTLSSSLDKILNRLGQVISIINTFDISSHQTVSVLAKQLFFPTAYTLNPIHILQLTEYKKIINELKSKYATSTPLSTIDDYLLSDASLTQYYSFDGYYHFDGQIYGPDLPYFGMLNQLVLSGPREAEAYILDQGTYVKQPYVFMLGSQSPDGRFGPGVGKAIKFPAFDYIALGKVQTVSVWASISTSTSNTIFQIKGSTSAVNILSLTKDSSTGLPNLQIKYDGTIAYTLTPNLLSAGNWVHIVMVIDSANPTNTSKIRLYINGVKLTDAAGFSTDMATLLAGDWTLYLGSTSTNFTEIDDVMVFDKLLADRQIMNMYTAQLSAPINAPGVDAYYTLLQATEWKQTELKALLDLGSPFSDKAGSIEQLIKFIRSFDLAKSLNYDPSSFISTIWNSIKNIPTNLETAYQNYINAGSAITASVKTIVKSDKWEETLQSLKGNLSELQRNASVAYLIYLYQLEQQNEPALPFIEDYRDLYGMLLLDTKMSQKAKTSIISEAISAVQCYVERVRMSLEPDAQKNATLEAVWPWMKSYATWVPNRQVFLYPESYIDPGLRIESSPSFENFQKKLIQSDKSSDMVESLFKEYLEDFAELSNLDFVGSCVYEDTTISEKVFVMLGKTRTSPVKYYYRTSTFHFNASGPDEVDWGFWQDLGIKINADFVTPLYAYGRLYLFWAELNTVKNAEIGNDNVSFIKTESAEASLFVSILNSKKEWSSPRRFTGDQSLSVSNIQEEYRKRVDVVFVDGKIYIGYGLKITHSSTDYSYQYVYTLQQQNVIEAIDQSVQPVSIKSSLIMRALPSVDLDFRNIYVSNWLSNSSILQYYTFDQQFSNFIYTKYRLNYLPYSRQNVLAPVAITGASSSVQLWAEDRYNSANGALYLNNKYCPIELVRSDKIISLLAWGALNATVDSVTITSNVLFSFTSNLTSPSQGEISFSLVKTDVGGGTYNSELWIQIRKSDVASGTYLYKAVASIESITAVKWYHIAIIINSSTSITGNSIDRLSIYVDGTKKLSTDFTYTKASGTSNLTEFSTELTTILNNANPLSIYLGEVGIYSGATSTNSYTLVDDLSTYYDPQDSTNVSVFYNEQKNKKGPPLLDLQSEALLKFPDFNQVINRQLPVFNQPDWHVLELPQGTYLVVPSQDAEMVSGCAYASISGNSIHITTNDVFDSYYVPASGIKFDIFRLTSNTVPKLSSKLTQSGISSLLALSTQKIDEYTPFVADSSDEDKTNKIIFLDNYIAGLPSTIHLDFEGANSTYYWELFFHAPFLIAEQMQKKRLYKEAQEWYGYVYNPINSKNYWNFLPFNINSFPTMIDTLVEHIETEEFVEPFGNGSIATTFQVENLSLSPLTTFVGQFPSFSDLNSYIDCGDDSLLDLSDALSLEFWWNGKVDGNVGTKNYLVMRGGSIAQRLNGYSIYIEKTATASYSLCIELLGLDLTKPSHNFSDRAKKISAPITNFSADTWQKFSITWRMSDSEIPGLAQYYSFSDKLSNVTTTQISNKNAYAQSLVTAGFDQTKSALYLKNKYASLGSVSAGSSMTLSTWGSYALSAENKLFSIASSTHEILFVLVKNNTTDAQLYIQLWKQGDADYYCKAETLLASIATSSQWSHVAVVIDPEADGPLGKLALYVNGVLQTAFVDYVGHITTDNDVTIDTFKAQINTILSASGGLTAYIGDGAIYPAASSTANQNQNIETYVAELSVYKRALAGEEIHALYTRIPAYSSYYSLNEEPFNLITTQITGTSSASQSWVADRIGQSNAAFYLKNKYSSLGSNANTDTSKRTASLSAWGLVNSSTLTGLENTIFSIASSTHELVFILAKSGTNTVKLYIQIWKKSDSSYYHLASSTLGTNFDFTQPQWFHMVVAIDTQSIGVLDKINVYVNKELITTYTCSSKVSGSIVSENLSDYIPELANVLSASGGWSAYMGDTDNISGVDRESLVDTVGVYSYVLAESEVSSIYDAQQLANNTVNVYASTNSGAISLIGSGVFSYPIGHSSLSLRLGRQFNAAGGVIDTVSNNCQLAEVSLWNMARSLNDIDRAKTAHLSASEKGLVGYWRLNEGDDPHSLINLAALTQYNRRLLAKFHAPVWSDSKRESSFGLPILNLDGSSNPINCGHGDVGRGSQFKPTNGITIEAWVNTQVLTAGGTDITYGVLSRSDNTQKGYFLKLQQPYTGNGRPLQLQFKLFNASGGLELLLDCGTNNLIQSNKWVHIAVTWDGVAKSMRGYINGELKSATVSTNLSTFGDILNDDTSNLYMGDLFDGYLAEVRLWNIALIQNEIHKNMYRHLDTQVKGLIGYWPLHTIFSQTINSVTTHYVRNEIPYLRSYEEGVVNGYETQIEVYKLQPFEPHAIAELRPNAYEKAIVVNYINNLLDWGDSLFRQNSRESIAQALNLYMLAAELLGKTPRAIGNVILSDDQTVYYLQDETHYEVDDLLVVPTSVLGTALAKGETAEDRLSCLYFQLIKDETLFDVWNRVEDRIRKIQDSESIDGIFQDLPLFPPPLNPMALVSAQAAMGGFAQFLTLTQVPLPNYRFFSTLQETKEVISYVMQFGSALEAALEKKEVEDLQVLQNSYEAVLLDLNIQVRVNEINQIQYTLQSLGSSLNNVVLQVDTYIKWITNGLNAEEKTSIDYLWDSTYLLIAAEFTGYLASALSLIPQIGSPVAMTYGGIQLSSGANALTNALTNASQITSTLSSIAGMRGGFARRVEEWDMQLNMAKNSVSEIQYQIKGTKLQLESAKKNLGILNKQIEQNKAIGNFLVSKFSNAQLYTYLSDVLSNLYYQMFQMAQDLAIIAQKSYQFELASTDTFIGYNYWDGQYKGLLAGEKLLYDLAQMEKSYKTNNKRRQEMLKTVSLLAIDSQQLDNLRSTGVCTFDLSEVLFDQDYSNHYCRQIKNITLSIPALLGPYQQIHATLTQTGNKLLLKPSADALKYLKGDTTVTLPDDSTLRVDWRANEQIAISSGLNDAGLFELRFDDERYLPFEGTGAVSGWRFEMPQVNNGVDLTTITDVIIEIAYTAKVTSDDAFLTESKKALVPTVQNINVTSSSLVGGGEIEITGTNFYNLIEGSVKFGTVPCIFTVLSPTKIKAIVPPHSVGSVEVKVIRGSNTSQSNPTFTYVAPSISGILPTGGTSAGGTTVTITGVAFTRSSAVKFGTVNATSFTINSDTQITAIAPTGSGQVNVTVVNNGTASSEINYFVYTPVVNSILPIIGDATGGTSVSIKGTGFTGASAVKFGSTNATSFTVNNATLITATAPAGSGSVDVTVTNAGITSATSSNDVFKFRPIITALSPTTGSGASNVVITGSGFTGASAVKFGSVDAFAFTINSSTQITAVPPAAGVGAVHVTVTNSGLVSNISSSDLFTYATTVTGVSPSVGRLAGGTSVTITGSNFVTGATVTFGGVSGTSVVVSSSTSLTVTTPTHSSEELVNVIVTSGGSTSAIGGAATFMYTDIPLVTGVTPNRGVAAGGTTVVLSGVNFTSASAVKFGSTDATSFTVNSDIQITAVTPAGTDPVQVKVTTPNGTTPTAMSNYTYDPVVSSISPIVGTTTGGVTNVTITGTGFTGVTGPSGVKFGNNDATSYTVNSGTQITAVAPAGSEGSSVHVVVTRGSGSSPQISADLYTYQGLPSITNVSPVAGSTAGGTSITITGTNFFGATAVKIGGTDVSSFTVNSTTEITTTTPAGTAGAVDVMVITPVGPGTGTGIYTYVSPPTVTSLSINVGPSSGSPPQNINITGTNFTSSSTVSFGGTSATGVTFNSSTSISATAPAHNAGLVDVIVSTSGVPSATSSSDQFTYYDAPTVSSVSPTGGSVSGGTAVTVTGTNFVSGYTMVNFDGLAGTNLTVVSSTSITVTSPAHSATTVHITVSTPGGTSSTSSSDQFTYS